MYRSSRASHSMEVGIIQHRIGTTAFGTPAFCIGSSSLLPRALIITVKAMKRRLAFLLLRLLYRSGIRNGNPRDWIVVGSDIRVGKDARSRTRLTRWLGCGWICIVGQVQDNEPSFRLHYHHRKKQTLAMDNADWDWSDTIFAASLTDNVSTTARPGQRKPPIYYLTVSMMWKVFPEVQKYSQRKLCVGQNFQREKGCLATVPRAECELRETSCAYDGTHRRLATQSICSSMIDYRETALSCRTVCLVCLTNKRKG